MAEQNTAQPTVSNEVWGVLPTETVQVGFEAAEGFEIGSQELGKAWNLTLTGLAVIEGNAEQGQWLKILKGNPEEAVRFASPLVPQRGVRFIDFEIKPSSMELGKAQTSLIAWGSSVGFVQAKGGTISVAAMDGQKGEASRGSATKIAIGEDGQANDWVRLTFRQDLSAQKWDLYVNGKLAAINVGMESEGQDELVIYGGETADTLVDSLVVGRENPLFMDSDQDGMPDAEELAEDLNAYGDDRAGDLDTDGISNIQEALEQTSPRKPGATPGGNTIYVDSRNGDNARRGGKSYLTDDDGPKASVRAAIAAAGIGNTIVILQGNGIYEEDSWGGGEDKNLTIKPLADITIKPKKERKQ